MILDATHGRWMAATGALAAAAAAGFYAADRAIPGGVRGGDAAGLTFGVAAAGAMAFEALLAVKKRRPAWRLGRAASWMRGHIWLGLLAVPLVLFHSGLRLGGAASTWLLVLFGLVTASGLFGLAMQQLLPRMMTDRIEMETIYEQIPHVVSQLRDEAAARVEKAADETLSRFFKEEVEPFLAAAQPHRRLLGDAGRAEAIFAEMGRLLDPRLREALDDLAHVCEERRQLALQARLHRWLHGWLFVHVPATWALLVLTAAHAVVTLLY